MAFWEAAEQTAGDAGSDLLEDGSDLDRALFRDHMISDMFRELREPGDRYRAL